VHGLDAAGDVLLVQAPDGLQLGPRRGDGDERGAIGAGGGLAATQDEIAGTFALTTTTGAPPNVQKRRAIQTRERPGYRVNIEPTA